MTVVIFLSVLLGAIAIGVPIAYALILCGVALMFHLDMFDAQIIGQNLINGANSFALMAVPFFLLAGEIMNVGGLSKRIVTFAMALVGHIKGGLGYVVILAACILASLSGSAAADAAALGALLVPMMVKVGHDQGRSCGLVAAGGIIAPVIPPSIPLILLGVAGNLSITKLFFAGIVPGILMGVSLCVAWWLVARREVLITPPRESL
ncbi:MAG TPA: TRAP transporter large permease subunit, partial [Candidatus Competibacter sp.]|nr:TRAP transporter large permease subunit [Candidatus Competibacter sp.]